MICTLQVQTIQRAWLLLRLTDSVAARQESSLLMGRIRPVVNTV